MESSWKWCFSAPRMLGRGFSHLSWMQIWVVTSWCAQQNQPGSSLLVCAAQSSPVLPYIIHPSSRHCLWSGWVCTQTLWHPNKWPDATALGTCLCNPLQPSQRDRCPVGEQEDPWFLQCSVGLGPVRAQAKGCQTPKPLHALAKQGHGVV